jgi:hypothetical protein
MEKPECILAHVDYVKEQNRRAWQKEKKEKDITLNSKKYKSFLQSEVNKLAKMIDRKFFGSICIDCGKPVGKQGNAAHFHNVGSYPSLRYNLHNIHLARTYCNKYSSEHKKNYVTGLEKRYSKEYLFYVQESLPKQYKETHLTGEEIVEKLKIVRKFVRDFRYYKFTDSLQARDYFNKGIGIYL